MKLILESEGNKKNWNDSESEKHYKKIVIGEGRLIMQLL